MQSEREEICRTPKIDLYKVWSIDKDSGLADIGKVAVFTRVFQSL